MSAWKETHRAVVFPWQCDQFGHMNVRWYAHWLDDAAFHLWPTSGVTFRRMEELGVHTVVARTETDFVQELSAGDLVVVRSGFVRVGRSSVTYVQRMLNAETGTLHARQQAVEVFFDPATRRSAAIPDEIRAAIGPSLVDPDRPEIAG
jgi:acyl-CoA thioester hydrolase